MPVHLAGPPALLDGEARRDRKENKQLREYFVNRIVI
jgi:hypothetical protein